jgi:TolA-binding protein
MMKNFEILFDLLGKRDLTPEEKSQLNSILCQDEEAKKYHDFYLKIENTVKNSSHIDEEDLAEYILFMNQTGEGKDLRGSLIPKIEEHLRKCSRCMDEFRRLNEEYSEVDNFLLSERINEPAAVNKNKSQSSRLKYLISSSAAAAALYLLLLLISNLSSPSYYKFAGLKNESEFYITRGRVTNYFQESIKALEENDFPSAIKSLKKDINSSPDDETIFYSYYIIGLSYMKQAEKNYMGLFPSYDQQAAKDALKNFQAAIEKNTSGKYPNITLNACFYAGKVNLMLDDLSSAKDYFRKVVENKGSKMKEAGDILKELE